MPVNTTNLELEYRAKNYPDWNAIEQEQIACATCGKNITASLEKPGGVFIHPFMTTVQCKKCSNFYGDGNFSLDEDGDDKYCRMCGNGGKLYLCGNKPCPYGFCQKCIDRYIGVNSTEVETDDWKCLHCNCEPLWKVRAICARILLEKSKKRSEHRKKPTRGQINHSGNRLDEKLISSEEMLSDYEKKPIARKKHTHSKFDAVSVELESNSVEKQNNRSSNQSPKPSQKISRLPRKRTIMSQSSETLKNRNTDSDSESSNKSTDVFVKAKKTKNSKTQGKEFSKKNLKNSESLDFNVNDLSSLEKVVKGTKTRELSLESKGMNYLSKNLSTIMTKSQTAKSQCSIPGDNEEIDNSDKCSSERKTVKSKRDISESDKESDDLNRRNSRKKTRKIKLDVSVNDEESDDLKKRNSRRKMTKSKRDISESDKESDDLNRRNSKKKTTKSKRTISESNEESDDFIKRNNRKKMTKSERNISESDEESDAFNKRNSRRQMIKSKRNISKNGNESDDFNKRNRRKKTAKSKHDISEDNENTRDLNNLNSVKKEGGSCKRRECMPGHQYTSSGNKGFRNITIRTKTGKSKCGSLNKTGVLHASREHRRHTNSEIGQNQGDENRKISINVSALSIADRELRQTTRTKRLSTKPSCTKSQTLSSLDYNDEYLDRKKASIKRSYANLASSQDHVTKDQATNIKGIIEKLTNEMKMFGKSLCAGADGIATKYLTNDVTSVAAFLKAILKCELLIIRSKKGFNIMEGEFEKSCENWCQSSEVESIFSDLGISDVVTSNTAETIIKKKNPVNISKKVRIRQNSKTEDTTDNSAKCSNVFNDDKNGNASHQLTCNISDLMIHKTANTHSDAEQKLAITSEDLSNSKSQRDIDRSIGDSVNRDSDVDSKNSMHDAMSDCNNREIFSEDENRVSANSADESAIRKSCPQSPCSETTKEKTIESSSDESEKVESENLNNVREETLQTKKVIEDEKNVPENYEQQSPKELIESITEKCSKKSSTNESTIANTDQPDISLQGSIDDATSDCDNREIFSEDENRGLANSADESAMRKSYPHSPCSETMKEKTIESSSDESEKVESENLNNVREETLQTKKVIEDEKNVSENYEQQSLKELIESITEKCSKKSSTNESTIANTDQPDISLQGSIDDATSDCDNREMFSEGENGVPTESADESVIWKSCPQSPCPEIMKEKTIESSADETEKVESDNLKIGEEKPLQTKEVIEDKKNVPENYEQQSPKELIDSITEKRSKKSTDESTIENTDLLDISLQGSIDDATSDYDKREIFSEGENGITTNSADKSVIRKSCPQSPGSETTKEKTIESSSDESEKVETENLKNVKEKPLQTKGVIEDKKNVPKNYEQQSPKELIESITKKCSKKPSTDKSTIENTDQLGISLQDSMDNATTFDHTSKLAEESKYLNNSDQSVTNILETTENLPMTEKTPAPQIEVGRSDPNEVQMAHDTDRLNLRNTPLAKDQRLSCTLKLKTLYHGPAHTTNQDVEDPSDYDETLIFTQSSFENSTKNFNLNHIDQSANVLENLAVPEDTYVADLEIRNDLETRLENDNKCKDQVVNPLKKTLDLPQPITEQHRAVTNANTDKNSEGGSETLKVSLTSKTVIDKQSAAPLSGHESYVSEQSIGAIGEDQAGESKKKQAIDVNDDSEGAIKKKILVSDSDVSDDSTAMFIRSKSFELKVYSDSDENTKTLVPQDTTTALVISDMSDTRNDSQKLKDKAQKGQISSTIPESINPDTSELNDLAKHQLLFSTNSSSTDNDDNENHVDHGNDDDDDDDDDDNDDNDDDDDDDDDEDDDDDDDNDDDDDDDEDDDEDDHNDGENDNNNDNDNDYDYDDMSLTLPSNEDSSDSHSMSSRNNDEIASRCIDDEGSITSSSIKSRRKKFDLKSNHYYKTDKKLRMNCKVVVRRLTKKVLNRFSQLLKMFKKHHEWKDFKSLVDLNNVKKRKRGTEDDNQSGSSSESSSSKEHVKKIKTKQAQEKEETLLEHLERIKNGETDFTNSGDETDENNDVPKTIPSESKADEEFLAITNKMAKDRLIQSSDSESETQTTIRNAEEQEQEANSKTESQKGKQNKKKQEKNVSDEEAVDSNSSYETASNTPKDNEETTKIEKNDQLEGSEDSDSDRTRERKKLKAGLAAHNWRLTDSDTSSDEVKWNKSQQQKSEENDESIIKKQDGPKHKKKMKRRVVGSDSDSVKPTDVSDNSDEKVDKKKLLSDSEHSSELFDSLRKKKRQKRNSSQKSDSDSESEEDVKPAKQKRKRIKKMASDSDSDNDTLANSQDTSGKFHRKNIRKVLKDKQVADVTKIAGKEEEERLRRIAERQKLYNEMYEMKLASEAKVDKLILDFDEETKKELISVHEDLVKRLKPHQAQGIKFMWDACFESLERTKSTKGSGCIVAHCMGLGKTFQVVTLSHTLLTHHETGIKTIMVICPLSTVLNWVNEFKKWLNDINEDEDVKVFEMTKLKKHFERKQQLEKWQRAGGVMILGYEMFRLLSNQTGKKMRKSIHEGILKCLVDPGPDLIVCDEGHLLKNEDTALSKAMRRVKTLRRIVLTGTPLQNNLVEYHCMVQFVKPNLLGTKKEFLNRFVNPITNGQFDDSTEYDVKLMKKRAHVLHKMLEGSVQRFDYSVLTPFLPPKQEYVITVRLTELQIKLYQHYLDHFSRKKVGAGTSLFADFQALQRIWTHPIVLRMNAEKMEKLNEKRRMDDSDSEGSLRDFLDDGSEDKTTTSDDSDVQSTHSSSDEKTEKQNQTKRGTRANPIDPATVKLEDEEVPQSGEWWNQFVEPEHFEDLKISSKLVLLFAILKECEQIGDKVLVFSQSLYALSLIEEFLNKIDDETQKGTCSELVDNHTGNWSLGLDYFRLDGQTAPEHRSHYCKIFNNPKNSRARLFLISTRAGGLGINLTAANRVIIFDASWNPSHDVQSIFRIYRFGQKKPCYVYRFLAQGTMEEKIYNRQITKLSLSCRVVDEQQIERHYSNHDLAELYEFEPNTSKEKPTLNLPKDRLLAEIFREYDERIETFHEHDSLLENKAEEELDEDERKQAWKEYEDERTGRTNFNNQNFAMQQWNDMRNMNQAEIANRATLSGINIDTLQALIQKDYPHATPEQQKMMTQRAIIDMYTYMENEAIRQQQMAAATSYNYPTVSNLGTNNFIDGNAMSSAQRQYAMQQQQIHQVLMQREQQANYAKRFGNVRVPTVSSTTTRPPQIVNIQLDDNDVTEVPTTSPATAGPTPSSSVQSSSAPAPAAAENSKRQEE